MRLLHNADIAHLDTLSVDNNFMSILQMAESMQNKKVDEMTERLRSYEQEHRKLEEECFAKQTDYDVTVYP